MEPPDNHPLESSTASLWMELIRAGNAEAQTELWEQFFPQLVALARKRLAETKLADGDEEDVALSVLNSFFAGAAENRFPDLRGHDNLWRLLTWMTHRKAIDWLRHNTRQKRKSLGESALMQKDRRPGDGLAQVADPYRTPDLEAVITTLGVAGATTKHSEVGSKCNAWDGVPFALESWLRRTG